MERMQEREGERERKNDMKWERLKVICKHLKNLFKAGSKSKARFEFEPVSPESEFHPSSSEADASKRRPNYMPTRGLAAVLNQGLATLGEKLGKVI